MSSLTSVRVHSHLSSLEEDFRETKTKYLPNTQLLSLLLALIMRSLAKLGFNGKSNKSQSK